MWFPDLWKLVDRWVERAHRKGDDARALQRAQRYLRARPNDEQSWCILASTLNHLERREEGLEVLRRGLEQLPHSVEIGSLLAYCLLREDEESGVVPAANLAESGDLLLRLVEHHPEEFLPYFALMRRAEVMEDWEEAARYARLCESRIDVRENPRFARQVGELLITVSGEEEKGFDLIAAAAEARDPEASLIVSVVLETQQPKQSRALRKYARRDWSGDDESWEAEVKRVREYWGPPESEGPGG